MKHYNTAEFKTQNHPDPVRERLRRHHADNLVECAPLMDRSIPLGLPPVADHFAINRYYSEKHRHGEYGRFWPLHKTKTHG